MGPKIVVILHLFYQDLWSEFCSYLKNIDEDFDLCISICKEHDLSIINKIKKDFPKARVMAWANRGADIGPFFEWMNILIAEKKNYEYLLKIHSKKRILIAERRKDPGLSELERSKCIKPLMNTKEIVKRNLEILSKPEVGMVGGARSFISDVDPNRMKILMEAENFMVYFMDKFKITTTKRCFFAGSMFWCKYKVLAKYFSRYRIGINHFSPGSHSGHQTAAHAGERLFGRIFENENMKIICVQ